MQKLSTSLYEMLRDKRERETLSLALLPKVLEFKACIRYFPHKVLAHLAGLHGVRYPEIPFVQNGEFICPRCSKTCNCKSCATRRNEPYISPRRMRHRPGEEKIRPSSGRSAYRIPTTPTTEPPEADEEALDSDMTIVDNEARENSPSVVLMEDERGYAEEGRQDGVQDILNRQNHDEGGLPVTDVPYVLLPPLTSIPLFRASAKGATREGMRSKSGRMVKPSAKARAWESHILVRYR